MVQDLQSRGNMIEIQEMLEDIDEDFKYFSDAVEDNMKSENIPEYYYSMAEIMIIKLENSDESIELINDNIDKAEKYLENAKNKAEISGDVTLNPYIEELEQKILELSQ